jgi:Amt family ammonium transporter
VFSTLLVASSFMFALLDGLEEEEKIVKNLLHGFHAHFAKQTTAGAGAIVSALVLGRRRGFYEVDGEFHPSNLPMACVGGALLWMGWFGFNAGSALSADQSTALVITNTQLASATCMLVWVGVGWFRHRPSVMDALNGAIAGLAGVTPAAGYISPWAAFLLGLLLGFASYFALQTLRFRWHVDDALDVSSVHGVTGIVGSLFIGFAADQTLLPGTITHDGVIFGNHSAYLLGIQTVAVFVTFAYTAVVTFLIFRVLLLFGPISFNSVRAASLRFWEPFHSQCI